MSLTELTIKDFLNGLRKKEFKAREVVEAFLKNIKENDKKINAFLTLNEEEALSQAKKVDQGKKIKNLSGVPLAVKDNILIEDLKTTAASKILKNYVASYDATVIKKLKEAEVIFLGKTNLDEFAMGSSNENSAFKIVHNPYDLTRVPGGSSGGSAAAVASFMAMAALGSDTGGSIRQPAHFCGVVGLKPTYGAVSRFGLIAMASSLDQIGPITKTVEDAALLFNQIKGFDPLDATSVKFEYPPSLLNPSWEKIKKLIIGLPEEYFEKGLDKNVSSALEEAIKKLKSLGLKFKKINLPHTHFALSCYYIIMPAEVSANLARYDGIRFSALKKDVCNLKLQEIYLKSRGEGFGEEVKRRIILGTFVLSAGYAEAYYKKAQKVRQLIKKDFDRAFDKNDGGVDVILTPVAPTSAFKIKEKMDNPLQMYLSDIFTIPVNLAGLPAISIPVKKYSLKGKELPVGFQLIGKYFHEEDILGIGQYYEKLEER